jgi:hypothetical protein
VGGTIASAMRNGIAVAVKLHGLKIRNHAFIFAFSMP